MRADSIAGQLIAVLSRRTPGFRPSVSHRPPHPEEDRTEAQADRGSEAFTQEDWTDFLKRGRSEHDAGPEVSASGDTPEVVDRAETAARFITEPSDQARALAEMVRAAASAGSEGQQKEVLAALLRGPDPDHAAAIRSLLGDLEHDVGTLARDLFITNPLSAAADAMTEALRQRLTPEPGTYRPDLAAAMRVLSDRLVWIGLPEEAVPPAQVSVDIYRILADQEPGTYRPDLAAALRVLSIRLTRIGLPEEAVPPAQESVEIYRTLADQ